MTQSGLAALHRALERELHPLTHFGHGFPPMSVEFTVVPSLNSTSRTTMDAFVTASFTARVTATTYVFRVAPSPAVTTNSYVVFPCGTLTENSLWLSRCVPLT